MKLFKQYYFLLPIVIIALELFINLRINLVSSLSPTSSKNSYSNQLNSALNLAGLSPKKITFQDFQSEVEFYLPSSNGTDFPVIFSTQKNPLSQVAALQKLIKIANIKGSNIKFIDLSSSRPYATL